MVMHATARCQNTNKGAKLGLAEVPCEEGLKEAAHIVICPSHVIKVGEVPHRKFGL